MKAFRQLIPEVFTQDSIRIDGVRFSEHGLWPATIDGSWCMEWKDHLCERFNVCLYLSDSGCSLPVFVRGWDSEHLVK